MEKEKYKILILYHSGAGSTKTVAEIYHKALSHFDVDIHSISVKYEYQQLLQYDFLIFAFPTYHCDPSSSMMEFVRNMPVLDRPISAFAFTTYGLFSGNTMREFIKRISSKNIVVRGYTGYRAPATDGALLLPPIQWMFRYERKIALKIKKDIRKIQDRINYNEGKSVYPRFKLYAILNFPNKILGKAYKHNLYVVTERCVDCGKCMDQCSRKCWEKEKGYLRYHKKNCEYCFRCIHHCPKEAIVLSAKTQGKPKCNEGFYADLKKNICKEMNLLKE